MRDTFLEEIAVTMGLFISELSDYPWKGKVFTFSEYPKFCKIEGDGLQSKAKFIRQMDCEKRLNFIKIYDQIRQIGIAEKVRKENMVKNIFVFTDSDFEGAFMYQWVLDYKEAWKSYRPKWYNSVPQIVFWNLKGPIGCPMEIGTERPYRFIDVTRAFKKFDEFVLEGRWGGNIGECEYDEFCYDVMKSDISREEFKNLVISI
uniref:DUF7788 domain-containing protein n=1 Tax=Quercus lobata TaxID=97700 RepID=A0A7N2MYI5_QUELO